MDLGCSTCVRDRDAKDRSGRIQLLGEPIGRVRVGISGLLLFSPFEVIDGKCPPTETFAGGHCSPKSCVWHLWTLKSNAHPTQKISLFLDSPKLWIRPIAVDRAEENVAGLLK